MPEFQIECDHQQYLLGVPDGKKVANFYSQQRKRFDEILFRLRKGLARSVAIFPFLVTVEYGKNDGDQQNYGPMYTAKFTTLYMSIASIYRVVTDPTFNFMEEEPGLTPETIEFVTSNLYRFLRNTLPDYNVVSNLANNYWYAYWCPTRKEAGADLNSAVIRKAIQLWTKKSTPKKLVVSALPIN